jgi:xylulose-5-phosphate/fructose-6-phosphate phosphoketolase
LSQDAFEELFTSDVDVVMAWHGYARALHQLLHGRTRPERFHVRGYNEQGTTTTPFDMVALNKVSRYHLVMEALRRTPRNLAGAEDLLGHCELMLQAHTTYIREHFEDMPEVKDWAWTDPAN